MKHLKTEELDFAGKHGNWYRFFMAIMFIFVIGIFLNSIYDASGNSYLEIALFFLITEWSSAVVTSVVFLAVIIGTILYITRSGSKEKKESS